MLPKFWCARKNKNIAQMSTKILEISLNLMKFALRVFKSWGHEEMVEFLYLVKCFPTLIWSASTEPKTNRSKFEIETWRKTDLRVTNSLRPVTKKIRQHLCFRCLASDVRWVTFRVIIQRYSRLIWNAQKFEFSIGPPLQFWDLIIEKASDFYGFLLRILAQDIPKNVLF